MQTSLSPGKVTKIALKLREQIAAAENKKSPTIDELKPASLPTTDDTSMPEDGHTQRSKTTFDPGYHGPAPAMTGGAGPRVGANYQQSL